MRQSARLFIALAAMATLAAPTLVSAADLSNSDRGAVNASVKQYFSSAVAGSLKGLLAVTTPDFQMTSLEGQSLNAPALASKWRVIGIEYGGIHGSVALDKLTTDGTTVNVVSSVQAYGDTLTHGEPASSSLTATHRITLVNDGTGWKIASDRVTSQTVQR